jgi:hypothetical protein
MSAKSEKTEVGPIKRLVLQREKVRDLKARTGVRTGPGFGSVSVIVSSVTVILTSESGKGGGIESNPPPPPPSIIFTSSASA